MVPTFQITCSNLSQATEELRHVGLLIGICKFTFLVIRLHELLSLHVLRLQPRVIPLQPRPWPRSGPVHPLRGQSAKVTPKVIVKLPPRVGERSAEGAVD